MSRIVAVEDSLSPFRDYLTAQGCQVISVEDAVNTKVSAIVLSGLSENVMGMQNIQTDAPVISASGRTPQDVWNEIQHRR